MTRYMPIVGRLKIIHSRTNNIFNDYLFVNQKVYGKYHLTFSPDASSCDSGFIFLKFSYLHII